MGSTLTLLDIVARLDALSDEDTIHAKDPWSPSSAAIVAPEPPSGGLPAEAEQRGMDYFLE